MSKWPHKRMDGWMDGWANGHINGWMDGWMSKWPHKRMVGWMDGLMDGWMDGLMDGWMMDGWMDGWVDGWVDGWIDGWTVGRKRWSDWRVAGQVNQWPQSINSQKSSIGGPRNERKASFKNHRLPASTTTWLILIEELIDRRLWLIRSDRLSGQNDARIDGRKSDWHAKWIEGRQMAWAENESQVRFWNRHGWSEIGSTWVALTPPPHLIGWRKYDCGLVDQSSVWPETISNTLIGWWWLVMSPGFSAFRKCNYYYFLFL